MRSIFLAPALVVVLALPALAATGEREARSGSPALPADGGALPQDSSIPHPPDRSLALPPGQAAPGAERDAGQYAPDNTGRNRQRDMKLEADDQSNDPADVKAVSAIRRALTDDASLSLQGHNVKIIVQGGRVTLRGPVKGEAEKRKVEAIVRKAAGKRQVVNELEATGR